MNRIRGTRRWIAALAAALLLSGCSKSAGPDRKALPVTSDPAAVQQVRPGTPKKAEPDRCGRYTVDVALPGQHGCKEDADCGWTANRPGHCGGPLCSRHYRAGVRAWVAAADRLHARVCSGKKFSTCVRVKCIHRRPDRAVCNDGKCEILFEKK